MNEQIKEAGEKGFITLENSQKNMMLITSFWDGQMTFRMIPLTKTCLFAEVIHIPKIKGMAVISQIEYEKFSMIPKLDDKGNRILIKGGKVNKPEYQEERKLFRNLYEYQIIHPEEIEAFIKMFAINSETYDYKKFMDAPPVVAEVGNVPGEKESAILGKDGKVLKMEATAEKNDA